VLVVEDNLVNQRLAVRLLEKYEFTVDVAGNGAEAVEMWKRFPYDLILMDCQMPDVDGYEATRRIRSLENGRRTTIVALTAHVIAEEREQCLACGMDAILGKPFSRNELGALLAATLTGSGAVAE
jgi:CheY-like chemotaxis protein